jgi:hypothetical protein
VTDVIRPIRWSVVATAFVSLLLVASSPAGAAAPCAEQIIDDWADNAVIDGTYPVRCYRDALASLPDDLLNYSSAADDIDRALQARLQGQADPGPATTADPGSSASGGDDGDEPRSPAGETSSGGGGGLSGGGGGDGQGGQPQVGEGPVAAPADQLFDKSLDDGSSSLPTPVIALLAVAGAAALVAAAWLVRRQLGRRSSGG